MATAPICNFGWRAPEFALPATDGKRYSLTQVRGPNGVLVMFICNHCPYVKAVIDRVIRDASELQSHGIGSVAICSNDPSAYPEDGFESMKSVAQDLRFPFPYLWDESQAIARAYDAVCTPDFFGYDRDLKLRYRGRLNYSLFNPRTFDTKRDLVTAMLEIATTGDTRVPQVPSIGCSIKFR